MPRLQTKVTAYMDGGVTHETTIDQRDLARWERQSFRDESAPHLRARFCAWNSLRRTGVVTSTFDQFDDACVEVITELDEAGDGDGLDPGQRTTSDTDSSTSPESPVSPSPGRRASKAGTRATSTP